MRWRGRPSVSQYCAFSSSRRFQCVISRWPAGNSRFAVLVEQVVHPDVVGGDVAVGGGIGRRDLLRHVGRDALRIAVGEAGLGPLLRRPVRPSRNFSSSVASGKFSSTTNAILLAKKSSLTCAPRVVGREQLVVGLDGPEVEVGLPAEREQLPSSEPSICSCNPSRRRNIASRRAWSGAKCCCTNDSNAAASPSSSRHSFATCRTPRSARGLAASPCAVTSAAMDRCAADSSPAGP